MARYDVNRLGRFSSPDPLSGSILDPQSLNHYSYTENDPINAVDPSGMVLILNLYGGFGGGGGGDAWNEFDLLQLSVYASQSGDEWADNPRLPENGWDLLGSQGNSGNPLDGIVPPVNPNPPPPPHYKECLDALKEAGKTVDDLQRALDASSTIDQAAATSGVDPNVLAAVAIRESGVQDINQEGGGGRGYFQIDLGSFPNADSVAHDLYSAGVFAGGLIGHYTNVYQGRGFSASLSLAGSLRNYNHGPAGTMSLLATGDIDALDAGTARGDYVSNVLAIAHNCF